MVRLFTDNVDPQRSRAKVFRRFMKHRIPTEERACKECGDHFETRAAWHKDYCHSSHKKKWLTRRQARGLEIIDHAMRWRGNRKDKEALAIMCAIIGRFLDEDKEVDRASW